MRVLATLRAVADPRGRDGVEQTQRHTGSWYATVLAILPIYGFAILFRITRKVA